MHFLSNITIMLPAVALHTSDGFGAGYPLTHDLGFWQSCRAQKTEWAGEGACRRHQSVRC